MTNVRLLIGIHLVALSGWALLLAFGSSTLAAGGMEDNGYKWWLTVIGAFLDQPETFVYLAGALVGGLCLHPPGMRLTVGRLMVICGAFAVILGLFLRAATRESQWIETRSIYPDGTSHVVKEYRTWLGATRTVETDES
jgi:hypothetical protein